MNDTKKALYAKNPEGKSVVVSTDDYDINDLTDEQYEYACEELGPNVIFYEEEC